MKLAKGEMPRGAERSPSRPKTGVVIFGGALYMLPWLFIFRELLGTPLGIDYGMLRQATLAGMALQNPYTTGPGFYNAPWMLLVVAPFALLPREGGFVLWTLVGTGAYAWAFRRMRFGWTESYLLLGSPLVVGNLIFGNYDWLVLLAATLPPAAGMWFVVLKPQLGGGVAVLWGWQALRSGLRRAAIVILPVTAGVVISYILGYRLPDNARMAWSADVWPWGIPIGAVLTYMAFKKGDVLLALAAAPFLSPYVVWHSWIAVLLPVARSRWLLACAILMSWVFFWWIFSR